MADNYIDLQAEIAGYLGRSDLEEQIMLFIRLAEARMNRELRLKLMERQAYADLRPGEAAIPLPDKHIPGDWDVFLEMRDLRLNGGLLKNLEYISLDTLPEPQAVGQPVAYSILGRELVMTPSPDAAYRLFLTYYAEIPPLGGAQPSNDILLRSPDLYLYGALAASAAYTRSSIPLDLWEREYIKAAAGLAESDNHGRFTANIALRPLRSV